MVVEANIAPEEDGSSTSDELDMRNEDGWEDIEDDQIVEIFVSLFDNTKFASITEMFDHCKTKHAFDIWALQKQHDLDFLGLVKLVNYVRARVRDGDDCPSVRLKSLFDREEYLLPVMEDDAVLYNVEEILQTTPNQTKMEADELRDQLETLRSQFTAYQLEMKQYLDTKLDDTSNGPTVKPMQVSEWSKDDTDHDYFASYSYNSIHELMLKDQVRTDAYRDFIYENKHLFRGKIVLDVGCGTGILSMFCAKAGAKQVLAVDNSGIIMKARQMVKDNKLDHVITCIQGKVEDIVLPVDKVDIIVSEWMGYCLLFESMLDSVIHARARFLAPDGLMVPSHTTIRLAPLADSDLRISHIDFWKDVYGFDMTTMLEKAFEEAQVRHVDEKDLAAPSTVILQLDLHKATSSDLMFNRPFTFYSREGYQNFEGFVIWFDTFFLPSPKDRLEDDLTVAKAKTAGLVAFSTGPAPEKETHWQQGICLSKYEGDHLRPGNEIQGFVQYRRRSAAEHRSLDIDIKWKIVGGKDRFQTWYLQ